MTWRVVRRVIGILVVVLVLLAILGARFGRYAVTRWRSWNRDRSRTGTVRTVPPAESPCCGAGIIVVNRDRYLCLACYQPVSGVSAPPTLSDIRTEPL